MNLCTSTSLSSYRRGNSDQAPFERAFCKPIVTHKMESETATLHGLSIYSASTRFIPQAHDLFRRNGRKSVRQSSALTYYVTSKSLLSVTDEVTEHARSQRSTDKAEETKPSQIQTAENE